MSEPFNIGDLILYRSLSGGVKGKVIDIVDDVDQSWLIFRVTQLNHRVYPRGLEVEVPLYSTWLRKRERYSHG